MGIWCPFAWDSVAANSAGTVERAGSSNDPTIRVAKFTINVFR